MEIAKLDAIIRVCLGGIYDEIAPAEWRGREREIVSRFCFGYLIKRYDHECIGMEVPVPQLCKEVLLECNPHAILPKKDVSKDIVIWRNPRETAFDKDWEAIHEPLAVMEWTVVNPLDDPGAKSKKVKKYNSDKCWLLKKAKSVAWFVGYAAFVDTTVQPKKLICAKISTEGVLEKWDSHGDSYASGVGV